MVTRSKHTDKADAGGGALRSSALGRLLWTRALPGSVAVIAALTFPEFSVGAGEFAEGKRNPDPVKPPATIGQSPVKRVASKSNEPLIGVRYGALLEIRSTKAQPPVQSRIADLAPAAINLDDIRFVLRAPAEPITALAPVPAPMGENANVPLTAPVQPVAAVIANIAPGRGAPIATESLDAAASYAASVFESFVAPPGLRAEVSVATEAPARTALASADSLDAAATYAVSVIERFVAPRALTTAPTVGGKSAAAPVLEISRVDEIATALVPPLDLADIARDAGLALPRTMPTSISAVDLATLQPTLSQPPASSRVALPPAASKPAPQAVTLAPLPAAPVLTPVFGTGGSISLDIKSQLVTRVDGKAAGSVDFQQTATGLAVRLGSIVEVLGDRYAPAQIDRIRTSAASDVYLPLAELQAQGIPISYDPVYDEFNVGQTDTRPKAARKVHMGQISAPERGLGTAAIDQVGR